MREPTKTAAAGAYDAEHDPSPLVEWYRVDPTPRLRRLLLRSGALMLLGMFLSASWFVAHAPPAVRVTLGGLGILSVLGGALLALGWLSYSLKEDDYLAARLVLRRRALAAP